MIEDWISLNGLAMLGAIVAGGLVGMEREYRGHAAGFRTHILVSLASALLMLAAGRQTHWLGDLPYDVLRIDPVRMAHGILTGVGFLCGGVILRQGLSVYGMTTAASLWITSAIGVLFGAGVFGLAIGGTAATVLILAALRLSAAWLPQVEHLDVTIRYRREATDPEARLRALAEGIGLHVGRLGYAMSGEGAALELNGSLRGRVREAARRLAEGLRDDPDIVSFDLAPRND
ncbi:MAG: MgtC/SapB family protein [Phenylobacterium sp.]|uniref:MgtC/SapB family protein n=1 Tax=Phenylobacterium sp. TaxID=1871053 RepID=UPI0039197742